MWIKEIIGSLKVPLVNGFHWWALLCPASTKLHLTNTGRGEESPKRRAPTPCRISHIPLASLGEGLLDPISKTGREFQYFVYGGFWTLFILWENGKGGRKKMFYFSVCLKTPLRRHLKKFRDLVHVTPCKWFSLGAPKGHSTNQHVSLTSLCSSVSYFLIADKIRS